MKLNFTKQKNAFTLIEFIFYIALFAVFFVSLFFILDIAYKNKIKNRVVLETEQQGLFISQLIGQEIRNAQSINSPLVGQSAEVLSLEAFSSARNPIIFNLLDGKIFLSESGTSFNISSDRVIIRNLVFINNSIENGPSKIAFSFDLLYRTSSSNIEFQYNKNFFGEFNLNKK